MWIVIYFATSAPGHTLQRDWLTAAVGWIRDWSRNCIWPSYAAYPAERRIPSGTKLRKFWPSDKHNLLSNNQNKKGK